jgi:hypothetical protein
MIPIFPFFLADLVGQYLHRYVKKSTNKRKCALYVRKISKKNKIGKKWNNAGTHSTNTASINGLEEKLCVPIVGPWKCRKM